MPRLAFLCSHAAKVPPFKVMETPLKLRTPADFFRSPPHAEHSRFDPAGGSCPCGLDRAMRKKGSVSAPPNSSCCKNSPNRMPPPSMMSPGELIRTKARFRSSCNGSWIAGLSSERRSQKDGRQSQLSVTAAGRAIVRSAPAAAQDRLIDALGRLPNPRRRQLAANLEALIGQLGIDDAAPAEMLFEEESRNDRRTRR